MVAVSWGKLATVYLVQLLTLKINIFMPFCIASLLNKKSLFHFILLGSCIFVRLDRKIDCSKTIGAADFNEMSFASRKQEIIYCKNLVKNCKGYVKNVFLLVFYLQIYSGKGYHKCFEWPCLISLVGGLTTLWNWL